MHPRKVTVYDLLFPETLVQPIWTLDARDNVLLETLSSHLDLRSAQMRRAIVAAHRELISILTSKNVDYNGLRAALVPQPRRQERAFVFDRLKMDPPSYGMAAGSRIVPILNRELTCSVLGGDLIHPEQSSALDLLTEHLQTHKPFKTTETAQLYCIYLNNLTDGMAKSLHAGLIEYEPYVGFIPVNYTSRMKDWLSAVLIPRYLKARTGMLCAHEYDVPNDENFNMPGWSLEVVGYQCLSMQSTYFDPFLSYKIERAVYPGFEADTEFSLSAISDSPGPVDRPGCSCHRAEA
jgi:hypothetical protein